MFYFINRFKLLGYNWLIKLPWQLLFSPDRTKESAVSYFFFSGLRPRFSRQAASPLAWLGFACSNFAKKRDCSQSSKKCFRGVTIPDIGTRDNGEPSCDISFVYTAKTTRSDGCSIVLKVTKSLKYFIHLTRFNELLCYVIALCIKTFHRVL